MHLHRAPSNLRRREKESHIRFALHSERPSLLCSHQTSPDHDVVSGCRILGHRLRACDVLLHRFLHLVGALASLGASLILLTRNLY